jgi:hypothetical protein
MRHPKTIEAEVLSILISPTEEEMLSRLQIYLEGLPEDESEYAQRFGAKRRAAMEEAFRRRPFRR